MNDQYTALYASFKWHVPAQLNIAHMCLQRWANNPLEGRRPAIYSLDTFGEEKRCSYGELAQTTGKLASGLRRMGVADGDRVIVAMTQCQEFVAACMAILAVGGVVVPLSPVLDARQVTARIKDARAKVAIVDTSNVPGILHAQAHYPGLGQIISFGFQHEMTLSWDSLLARQLEEFKITPTCAQHPAFLLYPIGTDVPLKGVVLPHSVLIGLLPGFVASQNWFPQVRDTFWTQAHWSSPEGLLDGLLPCLYFGQPVVALPGNEPTYRIIEHLAHYKVTNISVPWSSLRAVMDESPDLDTTALSLRSVVTTGKHPPPQVQAWCESRLGLTPNHIYGCLEAPCVAGHSSRWPARAGSLGKAYPGHWVSVVDPEGRLCAAGVTGEIAVNRFDIHGFPDPGLFIGHWNTDPASSDRFRGDWFLTGDLGHIDRDGYFWFDGHQTNTSPDAPPAMAV